jgi:signal transduction histidine kinase
VRQPRGFRDRLASAPELSGEHAALELVLGWARAALAVVLLIAIQLDPTEPPQYAGLVKTLLFSYAVYSGVVLALLRLSTGAASAFGRILHGLDLLWAVLLTLWTEGPDSHLFLVFVFAVLGAAYRWGLRETLATASGAIALLALEASPAARAFVSAPFHLGHFLVLTSYVLILGLFLGLLSEREKKLRFGATAITRVVRRVRAEEGPVASMYGVLGEVRALFGSERVLLAVEERYGGRLFLWATPPHGHDGRVPFARTELDPAERERYFFQVPDQADTWGAAWRGPDEAAESPRLLVLDAQGRRVEADFLIPREFVAEHACRSLVCVSTIPGADRTGRLFLVNPAARTGRESSLTLLQAIVRQVSPSLENLFLVGRLRTRIEEIERSRVARELHDGVVQSLIGLEMQLDAARREAQRDPAAVAQGLGHIQGLLRHEILSLRDLMEQLRPIQVDSRTFIGTLAATVDRFRRNTSIEASFVPEVEEIELPPRACRELARVVEEALVNVRKHSGAHTVIVCLRRRDGDLNLTVRDDGRGFPFTGRLTLEELDRHHVGPLVIKERVRSIGGTLSIESAPERGTELDITVPERHHE